MRRAAPMIALAAALPLAGCLSAPAQPVSVAVSTSGIAVAMSDGATCTGTAPVPGESFSGLLAGCGSAYPFRVLYDPGTPIRDGLEAVAGAAGLTLAPVAEVEIDGPRGNTWTFASPPPGPFDD